MSGTQKPAGTPKPSAKQLLMIIGGAVAGALLSQVVLGIGGAIGGAMIGLGAALGGIPYFRAIDEWKKSQE
ncbi:MAG: hypothetical protein AAFW97_12800 [Pseudomonadota bacterium]